MTDHAANGGSSASGKIEGVVRDGREPAGAFRHAGSWARQTGLADRPRNVSDGDGQRRGHRFSRDLSVRKGRHGHQYFRRNSNAAQGRGSDGSAERFRFAEDLIASIGETGAGKSVPLQESGRSV